MTLLKKIQDDLKTNQLDAVLIAKSDPFLSGYYPPYKNRIEKVCGFKGSAGTLLITQEKAYLFVDSRYTEQAKKETDLEVFEVPRDTTISNWMKEHLSGKRVVFDSAVHSYHWYEEMKKILKENSVELTPIAEGILNSWFGPVEFKQKTFEYPLTYAGKSTQEKLKEIDLVLEVKKLEALLVLSPENTSWILNERAFEKSEYPVVFERLLIFKGQKYVLFSENGVDLKGLKIGIDYKKASVLLISSLTKAGALLRDVPEFIDEMKAQKNETEIKNIKEACLFESQIICKFLAFVEENKNTLTETDCDEKLQELRALSPLYFHDSFQTIAASGQNAALAHYNPSKDNLVYIRENPLLLVDTGGHYLNGTTDMTRTIAISEPTELMKKRYTQVLKGHIALSMSELKENTSTAELDEKAHYFLRKDKVDYFHATSHGIGMMLGVHEYPPIVYAGDKRGISASMVFSNEPAFYSMDEKFGIRLENMLLSVLTENEILKFEDLLFIPFDYRVVDFNLLTPYEKEWLKNYHLHIEEKIFPHLTVREREILKPFVEAFQKG